MQSINIQHNVKSGYSQALSFLLACGCYIKSFPQMCK